MRTSVPAAAFRQRGNGKRGRGGRSQGLRRCGPARSRAPPGSRCSPLRSRFRRRRTSRLQHPAAFGDGESPERKRYAASYGEVVVQMVDTGHHFKSRFSVADAERAVEILRAVATRDPPRDDDVARNGEGRARIAVAQRWRWSPVAGFPSPSSSGSPEPGVVAPGQQERGDGAEKRYGTEVKHIFTQCGDSYGPRPVCR